MNAEKIRQILAEEFSPQFIDVLDESVQHAGHEQPVRSEGGHYRLIIVSDVFAGKSALDRHRAVYASLGMGSNAAVHALAIKAFTAQEWQQRAGWSN